MSKFLSVVVPCYNETHGIKEFHARLTSVLNQTSYVWEAIYVNDGSRDSTLSKLYEIQQEDKNIGVLNLSRNFGKEIALTAGLDFCKGDLIVVIDADLQDPPELVPELIAKSQEGFDIVYAQRRERRGETWLKKVTAEAFYRLMQNFGDVRIPPNTGDFRLMSRRALDALLRMRERHRFMKGLFSWVGFPTTAVMYDRDPRFAGKSSFNYWRLWNFALEGITSHTVVPLKLSTYIGFLVACFAVLYGAVILCRTLIFGNPVPGYPSLLTIILFLGGTQLVSIGVLGEYVGRIFNESKERPLYFVENYTASRRSV